MPGVLLGAYNFNEPSGLVLDCSGNGHDFDLGAAGTRAAGHTGTAGTKTAPGLIPLPAGLLAAVNASTSRTVMAWLRGTGGTWYVRCQHSDIGSGGWGILSLSGTDIMLRARNSTTLAQSSQPIPGSGTVWYHFAGTYNETDDTLRTYIDGVLVDSRPLAGPLRSDADSLDIMEWTTTATLVDDLRFYDGALTAGEIADARDTPVVAPPPQATGSLPITITLGGTAQAPPATIPEAAGTPLPVSIHLGGTGDTPPATVPSAAGSPVTLVITLGGRLSDGIPKDITLSAALAAPRWTASLGASMTSPTATPIDREVYRLSTEFVEIAIAVDGAPLTGGFTYAVLPLPDEPADVAAIAGVPINVSGKAGFLVGPGTLHQLEPGEYHVFARYVDDPEAPVIPVAGRLVITRGANL